MSKGPTMFRVKKPGTVVSHREQQQQVRQVRARWDAAQTTDENRKHWAMADSLSADAAAAPGVRRILRNRARYEVANNTYARGIVNTLANDCVGTAARIDFTALRSADGNFLKAEFQAWAEEIDLAEKLRTLRISRAVDGEGFGLFTNNPILDSAVKLDLRLLEAEQVADVNLAPLDLNAVDGIRFDAYGNPAEYSVLRQHPGGAAFISLEAERIPASQMLHFFIPERPGQCRGIPELTSALPLFAQLRRWTLAVIAAGETAADLAAILYSTDSPDGEAAPSAPFDRVEFERRAMVTLPHGWQVSQMKAEHPTSTYGEVKNQLIAEVARCLGVPFNVAAGNSSGYNYSSGRLDHQTYFKSLRVDRARMMRQVLDRIFNAWKREAVLIEGYLPQSLRTVQTNFAHSWFFDGTEHVDPQKEANAQGTRLANLTTTLSDEWGRQGADWEDKIDQIGKERKKLASLGLTLGDVVPAPAPTAAKPSKVAVPADDESDDSDESDDGDADE